MLLVRSIQMPKATKGESMFRYFASPPQILRSSGHLESDIIFYFWYSSSSNLFDWRNPIANSTQLHRSYTAIHVDGLIILDAARTDTNGHLLIGWFHYSPYRTTVTHNLFLEFSHPVFAPDTPPDGQMAVSSTFGQTKWQE